MITDINQLDPNGTYSYAEYLKWQFDDFVEIIKGKVYKMSPAPTRFHQDISREIERPIANYFYKKKCKVYNAPFDVRFPINDEEGEDAIYTVVQRFLYTSIRASFVELYHLSRTLNRRAND